MNGASRPATATHQTGLDVTGQTFGARGCEFSQSRALIANGTLAQTPPSVLTIWSHAVWTIGTNVTMSEGDFLDAFVRVRHSIFLIILVWARARTFERD